MALLMQLRRRSDGHIIEYRDWHELAIEVRFPDAVDVEVL